MQMRMASIGCCILCMALGYALGRIRTVTLHAAQFPTTVIDAPLDTVPTVTIDGIRNGNVHGTQFGDVRLFIGGSLLQQNDGTFEVDSRALRTNVISLQIPEGMQFVASSKGKKYYPIHSAKAKNLTPKNRIYFRSAQKAEAAGYRK